MDNSSNLTIYKDAMFLRSSEAGSILVNKNEFDFDNLLIAIKKKIKERTPKDLLNICKFLEKTEIANLIKGEGIMDNSIFYQFASNLEGDFIEQDEIIFRIGEIGEKFYIILKGSVSVLKPSPKICELTGEEYYKNLQNLLLNNKIIILDKTMKENEHAYPSIEHSDLLRLDEIISQLKIRQSLILKNNIEGFGQFIREDIKKEYLQLESEEKLSEDVTFEKYIEMKINIIDHNYYKFVELFDTEKKTVTIYQENVVLTLNTGQCFGDFALDNEENHRRNATVKTRDDSIIAWLDQKFYLELLSAEKQKLKNKEIVFFTENFFFNSIKRKKFENRYLNEFILSDYQRGKCLFKEGEEINEILIVKEGTVEISINKSLLEIHHLITNIVNLDSFLEQKFNTLNQINVVNQPNDYLDKITKKEKFSLFKFSTKEMLGIEEIYFGLKHLYTATVFSEKAKIYRFDLDLLKTILEEEKFCDYYMKKHAYTKIDILLNRLLLIKNTSIEMIDKEFSLENNRFLNKNRNIQNISHINKGSLAKIHINIEKISLPNIHSRHTSNMNTINAYDTNKSINYEKESSPLNHTEKNNRKDRRVSILSNSHFSDQTIKSRKKDFSYSPENVQIRNLKNEINKLNKKLHHRSFSIIEDSEDNNDKNKNQSLLFITGGVNINPSNKSNSFSSKGINTNGTNNPNLDQPYPVIPLLPLILTNSSLPTPRYHNSFTPSFISHKEVNQFKHKYSVPLLNRLSNLINTKKSKKIMKKKPYLFGCDIHEEKSDLSSFKQENINKVRDFYNHLKENGYSNKKKKIYID